MITDLLSGTLHVDGFAALHTLNGLVIRYQLPKKTAPGTSRSISG